MTANHDDKMANIERDEVWLREHLNEPTGFDIASVKRRVRIELGERWLASNLSDQPTDTLVAEIKGQVQQSLGADGVQSDEARSLRKRRALRWNVVFKWGGGAVAAAACLALYFRPIAQYAETTSISALAAFEQYEEDGRVSEYSTLLSQLSTVGMDDNDLGSGEEHETFDDLRRAISGLANDQSTFEDWS